MRTKFYIYVFCSLLYIYMCKFNALSSMLKAIFNHINFRKNYIPLIHILCDGLQNKEKVGHFL